MNIDTIRKDYKQRFSKHPTVFKLLKAYFLDINFRVVVKYRIQRYLFLKSEQNKLFLLLAILIRNSNIKKYGVEIGLNAQIKGGFNIHHVNGIVIGDRVVIGNNFEIYQQVTVGSKDGQYPKIQDNVIIYPGAKVIGAISISNNSIIGANAVVHKDVSQFTVVAGVPAATVKSLIED